MNAFAFVGATSVFEIIIILAVLAAIAAAIVIPIAVIAFTRKSGPNPAANPNLFPCPDCGHYISRQAPSCPHCGRTFTPQQDS